MDTEANPDWPVPPPDGFVAEDLDRIPGLPPHTELIDGSLVFVTPQKVFHTLGLYLLEAGLRSAVPADLRVRREMTVTLGPRQRPEPDLIVVHASAESSVDQTDYAAEHVVLAVEVQSPESKVRDRHRKPQLYADAGIPHFWRVEDGGEGKPVVYVYELDPATETYAVKGIFRDRLKLDVPFPIDINLMEIKLL